MRSIISVFGSVLLAAAVGCGSGGTDSPPPPGPTSVGAPPSAYLTLNPVLAVDVVDSSGKPIDDPATNATEADWATYGWLNFVAFLWPAESKGSAEPDPLKLPTSSAQYDPVFYGWLQPYQVFLPNAQDPGTWQNPTRAQETSGGLPVFGDFSLQYSTSDTIALFDQAGGGRPLVAPDGSYVIYEMYINESEFDWISDNKLYDAKVQQAFTTSDFPAPPKDGGPEQSPFQRFGATELKVSWKVLTQEEQDSGRYLVRCGSIQTPTGSIQGPECYGMVGLHIARLTPSTGATWYWATFEHVDNVVTTDPGIEPSFNTTGETYASGYSYAPAAVRWGAELPSQDPVDVSRVTPISDTVSGLNSLWQTNLGGILQHYELVGVLYPVAPDAGGVPLGNNPDAFVNTPSMLNVTMETFNQTGLSMTRGPLVTGTGSANCDSCHAFATRLGGDVNNPKDTLFTFLLTHAFPSP
jgi:hypothetical protein